MEVNYEKDNLERIPMEHYLERYAQMDPEAAAARCQIPYDSEKKTFTLRMMGYEYSVTWPEFEVTPLTPGKKYYVLRDMGKAKILVMRYLLEGSAAVSTGKFLTYREIPWCEVYYQQFSGRCLSRLAYGFGFKLDAFRKAMEEVGGKPLEYGDAGYEFELINGLFMRFALWAGDDEFPPSSQILFADNFPVAFHGEDMTVCGDVSIGTIKAVI
jgi:hypothetical protein